MISSTFRFASDEHVAMRAPADFALICPRAQALAHDTDGQFDPSDRWSLRSASVAFAACGLAPGHVVQIAPGSLLRESGELLVIDQTSPNSLRLRRLGQDSGVGQPPGPVMGVTNLAFRIATLGPQIETASYELACRYGLVDTLGNASPPDPATIHELREATVLIVLQRRYMDLTQDKDGPFAMKSHLLEMERDALLTRLTLQWHRANNRVGTSASQFGTRISR